MTSGFENAGTKATQTRGARPRLFPSSPLRQLKQTLALWKQNNLSPRQMAAMWRQRQLWLQILRNFHELEGSWGRGLARMLRVFQGRPTKKTQDV